jgi:formylglycine-generating enzyme required for sulfatase activity/serine/threonine protein kinase
MAETNASPYTVSSGSGPVSGPSQRHALPMGYALLWYRIEGVLGRGGFGITYLAVDTNLARRVAIKEYLPIELAVRGEGQTARPVGPERAEAYAWGLDRFITEARTLAKFSHPNVMRVHSVFEANGTAYITMEYEQGEGLDTLLRQRRFTREGQLLGVLFPLLEGLEHVHQIGYIHRDIKPGNIFIRADGSPVLLDFGSTRMALGRHGPAPTRLATYGYAPCEQYDDEHGKQGPWTDIYALGATLYTAIAGRPPADAIARITARLEGRPDPLRPAAELGREGFSPRFLHALDCALGLLPGERPVDIAAWRDMFPPPHELPGPTTGTPEPATGHQGASSPSLGSGLTAQRHDTTLVRKRARYRRTFLGWFAAAVGVAIAASLGPKWIERYLDPGPGSVKPPPGDMHPAAGGGAPAQAAPKPATGPAPAAPKAATGPAPGSVFRDAYTDGVLAPQMVVIPAGSFQMGDIQGRGTWFELPVHTVRIAKPVALGRYEVTFQQYDRFARATGRAQPRDRGWGRGARPVINVSWQDAEAYTQWLSQQTGERYRLPSEAEWEYASRAGTRTAYWWGNQAGQNRAVCDGCGSRWDAKQTAPVGSFKPNPFGLYDTAGNVWEWVADCDFSNYEGAPTDGSPRVSGTCPERVYRGGAWNSEPHKLRSAKRTWDGPNLGYSYIGLRLAREL